MRSKITLILLLFVLAGLMVGCTNSPGAAEDDGRLRVVATVGQIGNLVEMIGGDHLTVTTLMGAGADPHQYVATEGDVETLQNAEVIFYNGNFLEARMMGILEQLGERKPVVAVSEQINPDQLLEWEAYPQYKDPHIWFSVPIWREVAEVIRDTLIEIDAEHAESYRSNAQRLLADMDELHSYVQAQVTQIPTERRILVTAHDAFNYFGHTYGFEVRGLQGLSTDSEASTADVQNLARFLVEKQIRAIFIESSVPIRNVEALKEAAAAQGWDVEIGGELFSDAIGTPGTAEGTYIGMVRHNIDTIVSALLGEE
ncbi:MAG: zinc ABC transporter substrate-binding protein [Caldilineaceae bacterium]|nr:zinc ABC transporter substrate-binding protein [Caldilineaceae bacterium]